MKLKKRCETEKKKDLKTKKRSKTEKKDLKPKKRCETEKKDLKLKKKLSETEKKVNNQNLNFQVPILVFQLQNFYP